MSRAAASLPRRRLLTAALAWPALRCGAQPMLEIRHGIDLRPGAPAIFRYELEVLRLLLDKTAAEFGPYRLMEQPPMSQARSFRQLATGDLDLAVALTSREHEALAEPLRVCLHRGLLGVRLPIALKRRSAELSALPDLAALRRERIAQVSGWPDLAVLQANGLQVQSLPRLELFPEALRRGRADLFALGVTEAQAIVEPLPDCRVLDDWLIAYPAASHFFVGRHRPELLGRLHAGWELVLADGSFAALFERVLGPAVARARLAERRWIVLANPDLPAQTPLHEARLWHPLLKGRLLPVAAP
ncbi:hypothetical protein RQP53_21265 [Paucibacter sp. APW11]|uniref:Solute-binding protein family 3/N-terminal domain-containing protein n=1 Tax=Roseateles aquae TaxID=3077235 RepID=A0ABU3PHC0_9BURK|nr:hypothetical protein [Paucibacter sp. APW11]MDT9001820.1 hypothetical protein [Paucibacter sp. APW11]